VDNDIGAVIIKVIKVEPTCIIFKYFFSIEMESVVDEICEERRWYIA